MPNRRNVPGTEYAFECGQRPPLRLHVRRRRRSWCRSSPSLFAGRNLHARLQDNRGPHRWRARAGKPVRPRRPVSASRAVRTWSAVPLPASPCLTTPCSPARSARLRPMPARTPGTCAIAAGDQRKAVPTLLQPLSTDMTSSPAAGSAFPPPPPPRRGAGESRQRMPRPFTEAMISS